MLLTVTVVVFAIIKIIFTLFSHAPKKVQVARNHYIHTLKGDNIKEAYEAGRHYYSLLRNGNLKHSDMLVIVNDLKDMQDRLGYTLITTHPTSVFGDDHSERQEQ